jgi:rhamnosyltransferase
LNLKIYVGTKIKPAESFMELVRVADDKYEFYAFCDQDDYWLPNKIETGINKLSQLDHRFCNLYFSNYTLVNENLEIIPYKKQKISINLQSSLIINQVTGCTMIINNQLKKMLSISNKAKINMHDSWIYKLTLALNGNIVYDETPQILYRQHSNNVVGGITSLKKRLKRRIKDSFVLKKRKREMDAKELLKLYYDFIPANNRSIISLVANYRSNLLGYLKLLFSKKITTGNLKYDFYYKLSVLLRML